MRDYDDYDDETGHPSDCDCSACIASWEAERAGGRKPLVREFVARPAPRGYCCPACSASTSGGLCQACEVLAEPAELAQIRLANLTYAFEHDMRPTTEAKS